MRAFLTEQAEVLLCREQADTLTGIDQHTTSSAGEGEGEGEGEGGGGGHGLGKVAGVI